MGGEAYLFTLFFRRDGRSQAVDFSKLNNSLLDYGFKIAPCLLEASIDQFAPSKHKSISEYRNTCYELASKKGITEANILLSPYQTQVNHMHVRFSVVSPPNVIEQTFTFFKILSETYGFILWDTEVSNHLFLTTTDRKWSDVKWAPMTPEEVEEQALIPVDVEEFKKNKMGIRKRKLVLLDDKRKKPIRCDTNGLNLSSAS